MMMKNKKRTIALLLAVCMALLAAAMLLGPRLYRKRQALEAAQESLYEQWDRYLSFSDELGGIQLWTYEYVEQYLQEKTWDSLVRARAAVAAGKDRIGRMQPLQLELNAEAKEAQDALSEERMLLTETFSGTSLELQTARNALRNLEDSLQYFFCYQKEQLKMEATVRFNQEDVRLREKYAAAVTNHLYLKWGMEERWAQLPERYPTLAGFCGVFEKNDKILEQSTAAILDEIEHAVWEYESSLLYSESILDDMEAAVNEGKLETLIVQMTLPEGMPQAFPLPSWVQEASAIVYSQEEQGTMETVSFGTDLQSVPVSVRYDYDYVTREEYENYCAYMEEMGFMRLDTETENGGMLTQMIQDGYMLVIEWNKGRTSVTTGSPMASLMSVLDFELLMIQRNM